MSNNSDDPDSAEAIAAHLARIRYSDLPAAVVHAAKASILDTLACVWAGSGASMIEPIIDLVRERGGAPTSTIIGRGLKAPAEAAVFANAATVHQYDFDDTHDGGVCHPTSATFIPALAVAEARGGVSGRDLIVAVAVANDLVCRLALAINGRLFDYLWFRPPVVGVFGAAAAAAKILGATQSQHLEALGLTLSMACGTLASAQHSGSHVRAIRDGLSYRNGVLAAELAMRNVRGDRQVFDGPYGLYQAFFRGDYDRGVLLADLGTRYETSNISLKPWPSVRHAHRALTATADLMEKHRLRFDDIAGVHLRVGRSNLARCKPLIPGCIPNHRIDVLANLPFSVASLMLHGSVPLTVFSDTAAADAVIARAMPKVTWAHDPQMDSSSTFEPAGVTLTTVGSAVLQATCHDPLGSPTRPLSDSQRIAKVRACAAHAHTRPSDPTIAEIIGIVDNLEHVEDIASLTACLG